VDDTTSRSRPSRDEKTRPAQPAAQREPSVPLDDIPDMPASFQGGFLLPTAPSQSLDADARDWVARFLPAAEPERPLRDGGTFVAEPGTRSTVVTVATDEGATIRPRMLKPTRTRRGRRHRRAPLLHTHTPLPGAGPARRKSRRRGGGSPVAVVAVAAGLVAMTVLMARHYGWGCDAAPVGSDAAGRRVRGHARHSHGDGLDGRRELLDVDVEPGITRPRNVSRSRRARR
jgi:hypothetical protein